MRTIKNSKWSTSINVYNIIELIISRNVMRFMFLFTSSLSMSIRCWRCYCVFFPFSSLVRLKCLLHVPPAHSSWTEANLKEHPIRWFISSIGSVALASNQFSSFLFVFGLRAQFVPNSFSSVRARALCISIFCFGNVPKKTIRQTLGVWQ